MISFDVRTHTYAHTDSDHMNTLLHFYTHAHARTPHTTCTHASTYTAHTHTVHELKCTHSLKTTCTLTGTSEHTFK